MLKDQGYKDLSDAEYKTLPKIGYIAMLDKIPIAAGFLRKVEGNIIAQLDGLTSNPFFGSQIRHTGIKKVLDMLIADAKELKLKGIIAFTTDKSIVIRAETLGFIKVDSSVMALDLIKQ